MQFSHINTATHNIRAQYAYSPSGDGLPLRFHGDELEEIIVELLEQLNGWEEKASEFTLDASLLPIYADAFTLGISGDVYKENTGGGSETLAVYVTIQVQPI